jgi:rhomboid family GlyGly-CTERM serine protease
MKLKGKIMKNNLSFDNNFLNIKYLAKYLYSKLDIIFFIIILILLNSQLFQNKFNTSFLFYPSKIIQGQLWRLLTHPFVHVSFYHLVLDAGAFFLLYMSLEGRNIFKKILFILFCLSGSIISVLLFSQQINTYGYCGLSGIGHGLMLIVTFEMIKNKKNPTFNIINLILLILKIIYEGVTRKIFFEFMYMNMCGHPFAMAHIGGVAGGIVAYLLINIIKKYKPMKILNNH